MMTEDQRLQWRTGRRRDIFKSTEYRAQSTGYRVQGTEHREQNSEP